MRESALERYAVNLAVGCEVAVSYLLGCEVCTTS